MNAGRSEPVKAVLLDALGTLLELQPPAPFLRTELADRFGVLVDQAAAQRAIDAEISYYRLHLDEGRDEQSLVDLRRRCAQALREAIPDEARSRLPPAEEMVPALLASLRFRLYPEVSAALGTYRERGLRLIVVSNWDIALHAVLGSLGVAGMVDAVVTSAESGFRKPLPAIFEQALGLAGVRGPEAIHVGDSLDEDVAGARAAGIEPVLLIRDGRPGPPGIRTIVRLDQALG